MCFSQDSTSTSTSSPPQWMLDKLQNLSNRAEAQSQAPLQQYSGSLVAGFTPAQYQAMSTIDNAQGMSAPYYNQALNTYNIAEHTTGAGIDWYNSADAHPQIMQSIASNVGTLESQNPQQDIAGYLRSATNSNIVGAAQPYYGDAANLLRTAGSADITGAGSGYLSQATSAVNPSGISAFMNPYTQNVVDATSRAIANQNAQQQQQLVGNAISSGAWGGDRAAVAQAQLAGQQALANDQTLANLYSSGWQNAGQLAGQQANTLLGAGQQATNAATQQAAAQQAAASGYAGLGSGLMSGTARQAGLNIQAAQQSLGADQLAAQNASQAANLRTNALNSQAQNAFNAGQGLLSAAQQQQNIGSNLANLGTTAQSSALQGADAQLRSGSLQQALAQEQLNIPYEQFIQQQSYPYQQLNWLGGLYNGMAGGTGNTTTNTTPGPSVISQLGGLGVAGLGLYNSGFFGHHGGVAHRAFGGMTTPNIPPTLFTEYSPNVTNMTTATNGLGPAYNPLPQLTAPPPITITPPSIDPSLAAPPPNDPSTTNETTVQILDPWKSATGSYSHVGREDDTRIPSYTNLADWATAVTAGIGLLSPTNLSASMLQSAITGKPLVDEHGGTLLGSRYGDMISRQQSAKGPTIDDSARKDYLAKHAPIEVTELSGPGIMGGGSSPSFRDSGNTRTFGGWSPTTDMSHSDTGGWSNPTTSTYSQSGNYGSTDSDDDNRGGVVPRHRALGGDSGTEVLDVNGLPYRAPLLDWTQTPVAPQIRAAAERYRLDPNMFGRTLMQESGGEIARGDLNPSDPEQNAYGIGQIARGTADMLGLDLDKIIHNVDYATDAAAKALRWHIDTQGGDVRKGYMAYNGANMRNPSPLAQANLLNVLGPGGASPIPIGGEGYKASLMQAQQVGQGAPNEPLAGGAGLDALSASPAGQGVDLAGLARDIRNPKVDPWMSVAMAGAGMMAGNSPFALSNVGSGMMAGLQYYTQQKQAQREAAKTVFDAEARAQQLMQQIQFHKDEMDRYKEDRAERQSFHQGEIDYRNKALEVQQKMLESGLKGNQEIYLLNQGAMKLYGKPLSDLSPDEYQKVLTDYGPGKLNPMTGEVLGARTGLPKGSPGDTSATPAQGSGNASSTSWSEDDEKSYPNIPNLANTRMNPAAIKPEMQKAVKAGEELTKKAEAAQAASSELQVLRSTVNKPDFNTNAFTPAKQQIAGYVYAVVHDLGGKSDAEAKEIAKDLVGINLTDMSLFDKIVTQGGLQNAKALEGAREAYQSILIALKAWPSGANTTESNRLLVELLDAPNKWIAKKQEWESAFLRKNNYNPAAYAEFNSWFNKNHPADEYVSQVVPYKLPDTKDQSKLRMNTTYQLPGGKVGRWNGEAFDLIGE